MTLTVATANLGNHRVPTLGVLDQNRRLSAIVKQLDPDVACLQEARAGLRAPSGFRLLKFPGPGASQNPILVRKSLVIHGCGSEWIHGGKEGAYASKWDNWVTLQGWGSIANWHVMSQIDGGGVPRDPKSERMTLARLNVLRMRVWADRQQGPTIVAGDTNVDLQDDNRVRYAHFPAVQLALAGLDDVPFRLGTLGNRTVDRIFYSEHLRVTNIDHLPAKWPFDHDTPAATFRKAG